MPLVETYAVNFSNGTLAPMWNPNGWDDMQLSALTPGKTERTSSSEGFNLVVIRKDGEPTVTNIISLTPPREALPLDTRLRMSVAFDGPNAVSSEKGKAAEPWAVVLYVRAHGATGGFPGKRRVVATCQFNNDQVNPRLNGVRVNIPSDIQPDKGAALDSPLDYSRYARREGASLGARFILEHNFCGWGNSINGHIPGSATLRILEPDGTERSDHRVYSSEAMTWQPPNLNIGIGGIESLGVALVTQSGVGRISVGLGGFGLSINESAEPVPEPLFPIPTPS